jgi:spermidine synthase
VSKERAALGFAVFVSGGVLLGVEIAASRVLAPFFGNSLYVWGALIGVVLTGLSIGYWLGGVLADRRPSVGLLLLAIATGAVLVLAVPLADDTVLDTITRWDPGPRLNPLLAATILFGPLSVVLGTVTPIAVRIHARSLDTVGRTAGRLFSISTLGSIAGVFATAFVLVPELGTNELLALGAAALYAAVAVLALGSRRPVIAAAAVLALIGSVAASRALAPEQGGRLSAAQSQNFSPVIRLRGEPAGSRADFSAEGYKVRLRKETAYHSLAVVEDDQKRYLRFDSSFQSGMLIGQPFATAFEYTDYFHLALAYNADARNLLFVGLGGGSSPKRLWRDFPRLQIQVAELDPVVVDVAYRWFALPRDRRIAVAVEDGRRYLARHDKRWDVIALDAYFSDSIPFHLTTHEFLELVRSRLQPGGVVIANVIGTVAGDGSKLFRSFVRTYRSVFQTVLVHPVGPAQSGSLQNLIVVAGDFAPPSTDTLLERWRTQRPRSAPPLVQAINDRYDRAIDTSGVPLLTDDYAPTDALIATG